MNEVDLGRFCAWKHDFVSLTKPRYVSVPFLLLFNHVNLSAWGEKGGIKRLDNRPQKYCIP